MKRNITEKLIEWKQNIYRKPLIIHGARQVGKTFTLQEFGRRYFKKTIYINFEEKPSFKSLFESDISPDKIINKIGLIENERIDPSKTLLIFDEIQACERALTSLKYFSESDEKYFLIAAGSLLGVAINRENFSFPVGKVELKVMYPMRFDEFLFAMDQEDLVKLIRTHFNNKEAIPLALHQKLVDIYHQYLCTGGMPEIVKNYLKNKDLDQITTLQTTILNSYIADMAKYASASEAVKIRNTFATIPTQLAKENHKFQYKLIRKGASASHFGASIDWLCSSGIVIKCQRVNHGSIPLAANIDMSAFKLYMSDSGLLISRAGVPFRNILLDENIDQFKGSISENFVAQTLSSNGYELFYWESQSKAEVDFLIMRDNAVIPIEVKSSLNTRSKSLTIFKERYMPPYSIRISPKNFGFHNAVFAVPLYATFLI